MSINNKLLLGLAINITFMVFEFAMGILTGSLSLISDALCNLTDVISMSISYIARLISQRPADENKTFGYGRAPILAALLNGITLFSVAIYIFYSAYQQFGISEPIEGMLVMIVGMLGVLINGSAAFMFIHHWKDINMRSAFLNTFFDAMASAGAIITGVVTYFTGNVYIDSIVSACIGVLIFINAIFILKDTINILLESKPSGYDLGVIKEALLKIDAVKKINNIHVWQINQEKICLSCSISIDCTTVDQSIDIIRNIKRELTDKFNISVSTIEIDKC